MELQINAHENALLNTIALSLSWERSASPRPVGRCLPRVRRRVVIEAENFHARRNTQ